MSTLDVVDRWTGPGRTDGTIVPPAPAEDGWHPTVARGAFEHWYFDARLDDGHIVVAFLQIAKPGDMKPGVELMIYRPDGSRIEIRKSYPLSAIVAAVDGFDVRVAHNTATTDYSDPALPVHRLHVEEDGVRFDLEFRATVPSWKPGEGRTDYGPDSHFAWVVAAPRAEVTGTIAYDGVEHEARGVGYHDHNWGIGDLRRIIDHWHWGRVYAEDMTCVYADVNAQKKYGNVASSPLMIAVEDRIVLSTGEVEVQTGPTVYNATADLSYPQTLTIRAGDQAQLHLEVREVLHAHDFLDDLPVVRTRVGKAVVHRLLGHPGYFRFRSDFTLSVLVDGERLVRTGSTLHEMVALR